MGRFDGLVRDDWRDADSELDWQPDRDDYDPEWWSIHWGGIGPYRQADHADASYTLNSWRRYHSVNRGWTDIAYNYASCPQDGGPAYRLRGERPNGAQKNSHIWGPRTRTFVFFDGTKSPFPNDAQLASFARLWEQDPLPVRFHRDFPEQYTQCPGNDLVDWIGREGWKDYLMDYSWLTHDLLQESLDRGYWGGNHSLVTRDGKTYSEGVWYWADEVAKAEAGLPHASLDTLIQEIREGYIPRVSGPNRYGTAAELAKFPFDADDVLLANGTALVDAATAGAAGRPLLYTRPTDLPSETEDVIRLLKPKRVILVGGKSVLPDELRNEIAPLIGLGG